MCYAFLLSSARRLSPPLRLLGIFRGCGPVLESAFAIPRRKSAPEICLLPSVSIKPAHGENTFFQCILCVYSFYVD